jgi:hypothetical protein
MHTALQKCLTLPRGVLICRLLEGRQQLLWLH